MEKHRLVERSIIKKFRKEIWRKFLSGVSDYRLIDKADKIAICISGGKDSMLMAKCMQELQVHGNISFELEFLVMDPGYNEENLQRIMKNAEMLHIPIKIFQTDIFDIVADIEDSPCYLCARMRRGYLYRYAQQLGCNKIALGHHFDDVIETILMNMRYAGEIKTMMPKLHSTNFKGMELIRPMYMVKEADILSWQRCNELEFIQCACKMTEKIESEGDGGGTKREEMKRLIKDFREKDPNIDKNIFTSLQNVNVEAIVGYRKNKRRYSFLEDYANR